ncbi:allantoate permease [Tilletiaria anomala UBC 951]|uniref:Allantoate permease n=1 Tax=Tilletiaria anomala (strain ATCC 24038 / CBS 436.72 / UBC 951) TaxID=1037660 RepID=A0A066VD68_TILAU|nr:allantoate permease [Tilletiaria anomala UBC 951]KDN39697.1 allantoate permease [Tilletiaria anomala UBC 951]
MKDFLLARSSKHRSIVDEDSVATQPSVFDEKKLRSHYWPSQQWENYKKFDVSLRWTWREEKQIVHIIDRKVMIWVCVFFAILNLDRNNLNAANADGILKDLQLTSNDYNNANTIFRLTFLFAELPGQIISKRVGPDVFVPCQMLAWGVVTLAQFWLNGRTSLFILRALLGLSMIPDLLLLLSYFYRTSELPIRLCFFWATMNLTSFVSSFFSYGVLQMRGVLSKLGWRWLFLIEGLITIVLAIQAFLVMPASPSQTKRIWRKKPFLNERQATIAVTRILRDEPQKSTMHNREGLQPRMLWRTLKNWRLYPLYIHGLIFGIPLAPVQAYLTLSLRNLGFSTLLTQILSSVQYAVSVFTGIAVVVLSELVNDRAFVCSLEDLWALPCLIGIVSLGNKVNPWTYYTLATVLLSAPYVHPIQASWVSAIAGDVQTRTVAASLYNIAVQLGSVVSSQVYQARDAPQYLAGNIARITIAAIHICMYAGTKLFYRRLNTSREKVWNAMTTEEKDKYLATTKHEGNERLEFRFIH